MTWTALLSGPIVAAKWPQIIVPQETPNMGAGQGAVTSTEPFVHAGLYSAVPLGIACWASPSPAAEAALFLSTGVLHSEVEKGQTFPQQSQDLTQCG